MDKICAACAKDPTSHSFKRISEKNGVTLFFTQPSKAKLYNDTEGILMHIDKLLETNGKKRWSCIIDCTGFDIQHAMAVNTGIGLVGLLTEKYGATLQEIKIINPSWHIVGIMKLVKSFMDESITSKIKVIDDDKPHSVLEFM